MRIFVTGATGFIGSAVVAEVLAHGHQVLGLARSAASAASLVAAGAAAHRGDLEDLDSLRAGVAAADGVIHCGFNHDFANFARHCENDRRAIGMMGVALAGMGKPMVVTAGTGHVAPGRLAVETDPALAPSPAYPRASEQAAAEAVAGGAHVSVVRLSPSVHGHGDRAFVPMLIALAREKGHAAYVPQAANRWSAIHRQDAAALFRLALERGCAGATYHGAAEESITFADLAQAIGRGTGLPVQPLSLAEAAGYFGWFEGFALMDAPTSSAATRAELGWTPRQPGLIDDLAAGHYFTA
jgi:nucleoside-diphosphate-sugar epimerase